MHITVLGAGAWGTALACAFTEQHNVVLWGRDPSLVHTINTTRCNTRYLPEDLIPHSLACSSDLAEVLSRAELVIVVVPTPALRETLTHCQHHNPRAAIICASKGLETHSAKLAHQIASETLHHSTPFGVLCGPSFANEVIKKCPTAITLFSTHTEWAKNTTKALHQPHLRIYSDDDVIGAEIGGAVKNVIAIAAGASDGLKLGHNARAALITRGLAEMSRLALTLGGHAQTLMGLSGLGDLVLTCSGNLSRNRRVGLALAEGKTLPEILSTLGHVAEGVNTAFEVHRLSNQLGIEMPICHSIYQLLFENLPIELALHNLLAREPKPEK